MFQVWILLTIVSTIPPQPYILIEQLIGDGEICILKNISVTFQIWTWML